MTHSAAQSATPLAEAPAEGTTPTFDRNQRWLLIAIGIVTYLATTFIFAHVYPLFRAPGFGGSLLIDSNPIIALTSVVVWSSIIFGVALFAGRRVRPDVGIFAVAIALLAIRFTGGVTRDVYLAQPTAGTLRMLALELALIGTLLTLFSAATQLLIRRGVVPSDAALDHIHTKSEPLGQRFLATFAHFMVFCVITLYVVRSDERMQVLGMLVIASILASICAVRFIPATPSIFFWLGPIAAGIVGYLVTSVAGTQNLAIGEPAGYCAGLARALPLDFASAGVAGSIYGYWTGRGWIPADSLEPAKP